MGIFSRRKNSEQDPEVASEVPADVDETGAVDQEESADSGVTPFDRAQGPFDASEADGEGRLDLGALLIEGFEGMQLQLEVDQEQQVVTAATALAGESSLQLQAFAAPRSGGLWREISDEIAAAVVRQGGTAEVVEGPFGSELRTRMPSAGPDGRTVFAPARFLGVDGPRWFLRGVLSGRAAIDEDAARELLGVFGSTIVVRGAEAMGPRELLALTLPSEGGSDEHTHEHAQPGDDEASTPPDLNPFERGPEITEVR